MKKKLGIIGGMGTPASVSLLNRITELSNAKNDQDYIEVVLHNNSRIPDRTKAILNGDSSPVSELERSVKLLNASEVDLIVIACMTAHYYYPHLSAVSKCEIMHPVSVIVEELTRNPQFAGKKTLGLLGSTGLLKSRLIQDYLKPLGYTVITLDADEQERYFMNPIYKAAKLHQLDESVKADFMYQFELLTSRGAQLILGACSEIPLLISDKEEVPGYVDVFELLAKKIVKYCNQ
jgi:aspartate racemase